MSLAEFIEKTQVSAGWPTYTARQRTALASDYIRARGLDPQGPDAKAILDMAAGPVQGITQQASGVREGVRQGLQGTLVGAGLHAVGAVNAAEPMGTPVDPNAGIIGGAVQGAANLVGDTVGAAGEVLSGRAFQGATAGETMQSLGQAGAAGATALVAGLPEAMLGGAAGKALGSTAARVVARRGGATASEAAIAAGRAAGPLPAPAARAAQLSQAAGFAVGDVGVNAAAAGGAAYEGTGDVQAALQAATLGAAMGLAVNLPAARQAAAAWRQRTQGDAPAAGPLSSSQPAPIGQVSKPAEPSPLALPPAGGTAAGRGGFQPGQVAAALADSIPATLTPSEAAKMMADHPALKPLYVFDQGLQAYVRADMAAPTRVEAAGGAPVAAGPYVPGHRTADQLLAAGYPLEQAHAMAAPPEALPRPVEGPLQPMDPFAAQREGPLNQKPPQPIEPKFDDNLRKILGLMDEATAASNVARQEAGYGQSELVAPRQAAQADMPARTPAQVDDATLAAFFESVGVPVQRPAAQVLRDFIQQDVRPVAEAPPPTPPADPAKAAIKEVQSFLDKLAEPPKERKKVTRRPKAEAPKLGALLSDESGAAMSLGGMAEVAGTAAQAVKRGVAKGTRVAAGALDPVANFTNALGRPLGRVFDTLALDETLTAPIGDAVRALAGAIPGGSWIITNAGVTRDMLDARDIARRAGNEAVARLRDVADAAHALPLPDREDLYLAMTRDTAPKNPALVPLLDELRGAVDDARTKQLELKQLSKALYDKRRRTYLPRMFEKYADEGHSAWAGILSTVAGPVKGKKRRGEKVQLTVQQYNEYMRPWRIESENAGTYVLRDGDTTITVSAKESDNYLSDWYALSDVDGKEPGAVITAQRDYSEAELERMGEVLDAAYAIDMMVQEVAHDVASGVLFKRIADVPGLTKTRDELAKGVYLDKFQEVQGYVWFPKDWANSGSGGFKWGALGDKFVRADIAEQLRTADQLVMYTQHINTAKKLTGVNFAKQSQTIMGGAQYYLLNVLANQPIYIVYGGQQGNLIKAMQGLLDRDELARKLQNDGIVRAGQIRDDMGAQLRAASSKGLGALTTLWDTGVKFGSDGAQFSDDVYKYGMVKSLMDRGYSYDRAIRMARKMYDPLRQTAPIYGLTELAWQPYIKIGIWSLMAVPKMMLERPASAIALYTAYLAVEAALYQASGLDTDEKREASQKRLPVFKRNPQAGGLDIPFAQRSLPLPFTDTAGQRLDLDIAGIMPWGAAMQPIADEGPFAGLPGMLRPGTPITTLAFGAQGTNPSTGRDLIEPSSDNRARFIAEYFLPRYMGRDAFRLYDWFIGGRPNLADRTRDPYTILAGSFGVRLDPRNTARELQFKTKQLQGHVAALKAELAQQALLVNQLREAGQETALRAAAGRLEELRSTFGAKVKRYQEDLEASRDPAND